ncbi:MAG: phosphate signaling complex protein PhoU [Chloroflexota bacterium]|nr:phosphate signaling complex protein PhoU [Chloroflexota bacterium]
MRSARAHFDSQLSNLRDQLLRMGSLVDEALDGAIRALVERDSELATRVIRGDETINRLRYAIEEQSYLLLATQQPMAGDLRRIAAAISIATNMERMADHATGIAVLARRLNNEPEVKPPADILRMAEVTRTMLRRALDAYLTTDAALAREVAAEDEEINQLHEQVLRKLVGDMIEDPQSTRRNTYLLWVAHNLERWGDRIKNICERVVYAATGELTDFDAHAESEGELDEHDALADPLDNL